MTKPRYQTIALSTLKSKVLDRLAREYWESVPPEDRPRLMQETAPPHPSLVTEEQALNEAAPVGYRIVDVRDSSYGDRFYLFERIAVNPCPVCGEEVRMEHVTPAEGREEISAITSPVTVFVSTCPNWCQVEKGMFVEQGDKGVEPKVKPE